MGLCNCVMFYSGVKLKMFLCWVFIVHGLFLYTHQSKLFIIWSFYWYSPISLWQLTKLLLHRKHECFQEPVTKVKKRQNQKRFESKVKSRDKPDPQIFQRLMLREINAGGSQIVSILFLICWNRDFILVELKYEVKLRLPGALQHGTSLLK